MSYVVCFYGIVCTVILCQLYIIANMERHRVNTRLGIHNISDIISSLPHIYVTPNINSSTQKSTTIYNKSQIQEIYIPEIQNEFVKSDKFQNLTVRNSKIHETNEGFHMRGSVVSFREFKGTVRDTHEPPLQVIHTNSFIDLKNVVVIGHEVHLYDVSYADEVFVRDILHGHLPEYQFFINGVVGNLQTVGIRTSRNSFETKGCMRMWNVSAVFLSLWHPDNQYHLMNDNIIPLIVNLQSNPTCTYTTPTGFVCNPPLQLFTLKDDPARNRRAVSSTQMLLDMISPYRETASTLFVDKPQCVEHLSWGRGRLAFAIPIDSSIRRALHILREYLYIPHSEANIPLQYKRGEYNVLVIDREAKGSRYINNMGDIFRACRSENASCNVCCDYGARGIVGINTEPMRNVIKRIWTADVLLGAHGAGLSLMLFARRGVVVIDFMDHAERVWNNIFPRMTIANHGHFIQSNLKLSHTGIHVPYTLATSLLQCARKLSLTPNSNCIIPDVIITSHVDIIRREHGYDNLYTLGLNSTKSTTTFTPARETL